MNDPAADTAVLLTAADVARLLAVTVRHVRALDSSGRLPRPVRLGRAVRWRRDELLAWLDAGAPGRDRWETICDKHRQHDMTRPPSHRGLE